MLDMIASEKQRKFGQDKFDTLPKYCRDCEVLFACYGECPRNRFIHTPDGEPGLNYLCAGYKEFFNHINKPMRMMADLLKRGHYADEIMDMLAAEEKQKGESPSTPGQPKESITGGKVRKPRPRKRN